jgi:hypothetical protein
MWGGVVREGELLVELPNGGGELGEANYKTRRSIGGSLRCGDQGRAW